MKFSATGVLDDFKIFFFNGSFNNHIDLFDDYDIYFGYFEIHGQLISQLMYISSVLNVFDKMHQGKTMSSLKNLGTDLSWNLFISLREA